MVIKLKTVGKTLVSLGALAGAAGLLVLPAQAHHSFAMYDMRRVEVFTGVVDGIDPAPNHLAINFAVMNGERNNVIRDDDGQPIFWSVEMGGSAQMARQGVSVNSFPRGTVFSVALHPLRNGEPGGSREGAMFRCPDGVRPEPGMHCDSVEGHIAIGTGALPEPSE
jgi:hypothetical protein